METSRLFFFETGKTSEDWDNMEKQLIELQYKKMLHKSGFKIKENASECTMFYASNDMPPTWVLNMNNTLNTHKEAADKIKELHSWNMVLFVLIEDGTLIPLREDDKDRNINEFKYLFRL